MRDRIDDITIVGGGDAGLLTGLCIRQLNPNVEIEVVDDFTEDPPEIGKSTFKLIVDILHSFLQIDEQEFVEDVKPIWKASVFFRDWCGYPPFHFPFDHLKIYPNQPQPNLGERYYYVYDEVLPSTEYLTNNEEMVAQGKSPFFFTGDGGLDRYPSFAYHLNTKRFNSFLREICEERGISLVNDRITTVHTDGNRVTSVESSSETYTADLYVDASGFARVIKGELDGQFNDFGLPLDSAFNARVDRSLSDVIPATVVETGDYGWFWQIDTYDHRDLGYVFASDFVGDDEALSEFLAFCDERVSKGDVSKYQFTSGYHERAWVENCVTVGNAEGFVEPLQSTGLTASAQAGVVLSILLSSHDHVNHAGIRDYYNASVERSWESIFDFICVHYRYSRGENEFWDAMTSLDASQRLSYIIEAYNENGLDTNVDPIEINDDVGSLMMFPLVSFYAIMGQMGVESDLYENQDFEVSDAVREGRAEFFTQVKSEVEQYLTVEEVYDGLSLSERKYLTPSQRRRYGYGHNIGT